MSGRDDLERARARMVEIREQTRVLIIILTAEQALKAQRVVREAGKRGR